MVQRYVAGCRQGGLTADTYAPAAYLQLVPERCRRRRLTQIRTLAHWLAEATGRWESRPRSERPCPHCGAALEDAHHMVFVCPRYTELRAEYADLFQDITWGPDTAGPLAVFLGHRDQKRLAQFVHLCHEAHSDEQAP
jgi:hypothetical protein